MIDIAGNIFDKELEISSLLGKIDIFHNLSGKRSKKSEQISVFVE